MEKITVVGFMGAGKTSYLAGMYDYMSKGVSNLTLYACNDQDYYLRVLWSGLCQGSWPYPTDNINSYTFSLLRSFVPVMDFEWLDYPGGTLLDSTSEVTQDINKQIAESACLLLLLNGESFAFQEDANGNQLPIQADSPEEYMQIVTDNLQQHQVAAIMTRLSQLGVAGIKLPPIGIVITKSDLIEDRWIPYTAQIIKNNFSAVFGDGIADQRIVMMAAVTLLGNGKSYGCVQPEDVELPVAFAVLSALRRHYSDSRKAKEQKEKQLKSHDTGWNRFFFAENLAKERAEIEEMENSLKQLRQDAGHLIKLFDDSKPIYINGLKQNLHSFFEHEFL